MSVVAPSDQVVRRKSGVRLVVGIAGSFVLHAALGASALWIGPIAPPAVKIEFDVVESATLIDFGQGTGDQNKAEIEVPQMSSAPVQTQEPAPEASDKVPEPKEGGRVVVQTPPPKTPPPKTPPDPKEKLAKATKKKRAKKRTEAGHKKKPVSDKPRRPYRKNVAFKVRPIPGVMSSGPGNAVMTAMVDAREARRSPHRALWNELVRALPDYLRVAGESGLDPLEHYDNILIASADLRSLRENVLVATARGTSPQMRSNLDKAAGESLQWELREGLWSAKPQQAWWVAKGDDRLFFEPAPAVVAFAKPEMSSFVKRFGAKAAQKPSRAFPRMPAPIGGERSGMPAVVVVEASKMRVALGALPSPLAVQAVLHDDLKPLLRARFLFANEQQAARFAEQWPQLQREMASSLSVRLLGYSDMIERVAHKRDGKRAVYLELRLESKEVQRLIRTGARMIVNRTRHLRPKPTPKTPSVSPDTNDPLQITGSSLGAAPRNEKKNTPKTQRAVPPSLGGSKEKTGTNSSRGLGAGARDNYPENRP